MPLLIPVSELYRTNLISELKNCHAEKGYTYISYIARGKNTDKLREHLQYLSDAIFYLNMFTVGTDNNTYLHHIKETAMCDCNFLEEDLSSSAIDFPILLEDGGLILTEDGLYYIEQE